MGVKTNGQGRKDAAVVEVKVTIKSGKRTRERQGDEAERCSMRARPRCWYDVEDGWSSCDENGCR